MVGAHLHERELEEVCGDERGVQLLDREDTSVFRVVVGEQLA